MDINTLMDEEAEEEEEEDNNKEAMLMMQLGGLMVFNDNDNNSNNNNKMMLSDDADTHHVTTTTTATTTTTTTNNNNNNMNHQHNNPCAAYTTSPSSTPDAASSWHLNLFHHSLDPTTRSSSSSSSSSSSLQLVDNTHPTLPAVGDIHKIENNINGRDVINYDRVPINPSSSSVQLLFEPMINSSTMPPSPTRSSSDVINEVCHHNDDIHINDNHSHDGVISNTSKLHIHVNRDDHVMGDASGDNRIEHGINDESDFSLQMFTLGTNSNNNKNNGGLNIMEYDKHDHEFYDGHDASSQVPRIYMPVTSNVHHDHKKSGSGVQSAAMTMSSSKRKRGSRGSCKNVQERENQRMTHIVVERNRRRQMNEHLRILRALMPPSYVQRGDQASIIGGAIEFVRELEQLLQCLESQKRRRMNNNNNMGNNTDNPAIDMHSISNGPDTFFIDNIDEDKMKKTSILNNILEDMNNVDATSRMGMDMQTMMMVNNNYSNALLHHNQHHHHHHHHQHEDMDMAHDHNLQYSSSSLVVPHRDNDYNSNNVILGLQCIMNNDDDDDDDDDDDEEVVMGGGGGGGGRGVKEKEKEEEEVGHAKSRLVDIEVKMVDRRQQLLLIKILSQRRRRQLLHTLTALHTHLHLLILHTNVTTLHNTVLYSFTVQINMEGHFTAEQIATSVHDAFIQLINHSPTNEIM